MTLPWLTTWQNGLFQRLLSNASLKSLPHTVPYQISELQSWSLWCKLECYFLLFLFPIIWYTLVDKGFLSTENFKGDWQRNTSLAWSWGHRISDNYPKQSPYKAATQRRLPPFSVCLSGQTLLAGWRSVLDGILRFSVYQWVTPVLISWTPSLR